MFYASDFGWILIITAVAAVYLIQPEIIALSGRFAELQSKKWWLLARLWPRLQLDILMIKIRLRLHGQLNQTKQPQTK